MRGPGVSYRRICRCGKAFKLWPNSPALSRSPRRCPCGPDAARAAESIAAYVDAGFDEIYVSQMGPDQEGGIRFLAEEVLPILGL